VFKVYFVVCFDLKTFKKKHASSSENGQILPML
jgi:hypothetical protein